MKTVLWSFGLTLTAALTAQAQNYSGPAAVLGAPRAATLGFPVAAGTYRPAVIAAAHSEMNPPPLLVAGPTVPAGPAMTPFKLIADPKPMPSGAGIDEGKAEPLGPPMTSAPGMNPTPTYPGGPMTYPSYPGAPLPGAAFPGGPIYSSAPPVDYEDPLVQGGNFYPQPYFNGGRLQVSAEYLMWWTSGYTVAPLLTTGPAASNGILGAPGVNTLYGGQTVNNGISNGFRTSYAWWFGPAQRWAFDGSFFYLAQTGNTALFGSPGINLLARPFNNLNAGAPSAELVSDPGLYAGGVAISNTTSLWGSDINLRRKICQSCSSYFDVLAGYRFLSLSESLTIQEQSAQLPPINPALPLYGTAFDRFRTTNQFNGGQIGFTTGVAHGRWLFNLRSTIAAGTTSAIVYVDGGQNVVLPSGATSTSAGGLYALSSNIGHYSRQLFSVVPEVNLNVGYSVTPNCRLFVGYNFLYWTSVLRPGNQIDQGLDVNRIPNFGGSPVVLNSPHPIVPQTSRDIVIQGINFGLSCNW